MDGKSQCMKACTSVVDLKGYKTVHSILFLKCNPLIIGMEDNESLVFK